ncbi:Protein of uncharacterised function (DUF3816) [Mycoplasmopsis bovigenitalium]|uniref:Protein of uncharacterized function (DUF3816) n=1 Tax=Mycoplasmopsis bovigenitalium TaxID=2112 RepID=A0A449A905_9BACT|nr:Protein of uncharacterised function (DUF3816) [Mycoplasmopsis bovigenitalium]
MYWNKRISLKISLTGLLLALMIVFDVWSQLMPFNGFLKFNLSLIFTLTIFQFIGFKWGVFSLITLFLFSPAYSSLGYDIAGLFGTFMQVLTQFVFVMSYLLLNKLFFRDKNQKIKSKNLADLFKIIFAILSTTLIMVAINIFFATPLFFKLFKLSKHYDFIHFSKEYGKFKALFFFIPNYYLGTFVTYFLFNIANLSINSIVIYISNYNINRIAKNIF